MISPEVAVVVGGLFVRFDKPVSKQAISPPAHILLWLLLLNIEHCSTTTTTTPIVCYMGSLIYRDSLAVFHYLQRGASDCASTAAKDCL